MNELDVATIIAKAKHSVNITKPKKIYLSSHYNATCSYFYIHWNLENISKDLIVNSKTKPSLSD